MSDLRLHQTIYADSTCYYDGQIVEICKTILLDAITDSNGKTEIYLGAGHNWGCLPSRKRIQIIANKSDIRPFIERKIEDKKIFFLSRQESINLNEQLESGKMLLFVENFRDRITLSIFELNKTYTSLKHGKIMEFDQKHKTLKLKDFDNLPHNIFNNIEEAVNCLEKMIIREL